MKKTKDGQSLIPVVSTAAQLRRLWLDFFAERGHKFVASASLLPMEDPSLLFTTAGMVPFKGYFSGHSQAPWRRAASVQKCLRTTDLDQVGKTDRHCSFFEMLGNFSFGDYFKTQAIQLAWEFSTAYLKLPQEKIYVTVFNDDKEAEGIWREEIGLAASHIKRLGKTDNWWGPAGEQGPCGPCSELYLDRGADICQNCQCSKKEECAPGGEGERFTEYWNLVFNEFYADAKGKLHPLAQKGIDTGAGLERILALLGGKASIYETTELYGIIQAIEDINEELSLGNENKRVTYNSTTKVAFRVLCDHARAVVFSMADGIFPGNTGRSYVVRRIIRRALLYARELHIYQPILHRLVETVVRIYGEAYPELMQRKMDIERRLLVEERRFLETLELGLRKWIELSSHYQKQAMKVFPGKDAFLLYDTYGFPLELTLELASKANLEVGISEYETEMASQRKRSTQAVQWNDLALPTLQLQATAFVGYESTQARAKIVALIQNQRSVHSCEAGSSAWVILDRTPFYPEGGGQVGDTGQLITATANGAIFTVEDTQKRGDLILHIGHLRSGRLQVGEELTANIDAERREALKRYHSATHLLNHALKEILGAHVAQTGSLVAPDHLRFDFSHTEKIPADTLDKISLHVNTAIAKSGKVSARVLPIEEARKEGAVATFGEKYGEHVRIIGMGDKSELSLEFCGGCHVNNTSDILYFHIVKQSSPGAGNRRIEAIVGEQVEPYLQTELEQLRQEIDKHEQEVSILAQEAKQGLRKQTWQELQIECQLPERAAKLLKQPQDLVSLARQISLGKNQLQSKRKIRLKYKKDLASSTNEELKQQVEASLAKAREVGALKVITRETSFDGMEQLYQLSDKIKERAEGVVALLGARNAKGALLLFSADKLALAQGLHMSDLIREAAKLIQGSGGGRPQAAQAGGKDAEGLSAALELAYNRIVEQVR